MLLLLSDRIGDHFEAGMSVLLFWDLPDEDEDAVNESIPYKNAIDLHYRLDDEWREMIIGKGHTMRSFMSENWEEIEWGDFRLQEKTLDPDTHLLSLVDDQMKVMVEILSQSDLESEREYEEGLAMWETQEGSTYRCQWSIPPVHLTFRPDLIPSRKLPK
jgi:hypothetical protein